MESEAEGCSLNSFATGISEIAGATRDDTSISEDASFASDAGGMNPGSSGK
jgi:hypothetical protein